MPSSRISGFYKNSLTERARIVAEWANLSEAEQQALIHGLPINIASEMIENVIGLYGLPLGIATNFMVNDKDYLIPMVIEEPSVVAACSFAAKLVRAGGGFKTTSDEPLMIGQIQVLDLDDLDKATEMVMNAKADLLAQANDPDLFIVQIGGGARDIEVRKFEATGVGPMLVLHLIYDARDAMGANMINTACEKLAPTIEKLTGGRVNLRILSNLADRRTAQATATIPAETLTTKNTPGEMVVQSIVEAGVFAEVDSYRATTHNKGIMNGIDAVLLATGNDWRAVEAGAHAYASRTGRYTSLTRWWQDDDGNLRGHVQMPMAIGMVGGATKVHPVASTALKILGVETARELSEVIVAVGLAQNLAAIRALATEGIQAGHMALHARQLAIAAGAEGEQIGRIVETMIAEGKILLERARELIKGDNE